LSDDLSFLRDSISRFVADGIYLLAGAPSGGKSLLSTQVGLDLGRQDIRSLFILTEQGSSNLKETATRITTDWDDRDVSRALRAVPACVRAASTYSGPSVRTQTSESRNAGNGRAPSVVAR
jgi:hypothetical protein